MKLSTRLNFTIPTHVSDYRSFYLLLSKKTNPDWPCRRSQSCFYFFYNFANNRSVVKQAAKHKHTCNWSCLLLFVPIATRHGRFCVVKGVHIPAIDGKHACVAKVTIMKMLRLQICCI